MQFSSPEKETAGIKEFPIQRRSVPRNTTRLESFPTINIQISTTNESVNLDFRCFYSVNQIRT